MTKYFRDIWLGFWTVLVGMQITLKHLFAHKVTMQYPDIFKPIESGYIPNGSRNRLFVDMDECNGCGGCERDCPVNCITVETVKAVPGDEIAPLKSGGKRTLWVLKHEIDNSKCCFCSLCVEACPTGAIYHTKEFDYSTYDRGILITNFSKMTPDEINDKQDRYAKYQIEKKKEDAAKKAAAAAAATIN